VTPKIGDGLNANFFSNLVFDFVPDALDFDGVDDRVEITASDSLELDSASTVEVRFKTTFGSGSWMPILTQGGQTEGGQTFNTATFMLWLNQNTGELELDFNDTSGHQTFIPVGTLSGSDWQNVAVTFDPSIINGDPNVHVYVNGVESFSGTIGQIAVSPVGQPLLIGATPTDNRAFNGIIDDVAVWDVVRSAEEIEEDFADGIDDTNAAGLVGYWRFEEANGTVAEDSSPLENDGVLIGDVTRIQVTPPAYPDFDTIVPDHSSIDPSVFYVTVLEDFAGFDDLDDQFAVAWNGQIDINPEPLSPGPVTFTLFSDGRSRMFIDDELVVDHTHTSIDVLSRTDATVDDLSAGIHNIRIEYVHNEGPATLAVSWDLEGGNTTNFGSLQQSLLRTDATLNDATASGLDDLVISDDNGVRVIHGRDRSEWADLSATSISAIENTAGGWSVAGVGDVNRDGRNDIAMVDSGELRIYNGGGLPDALSLVSTITGLPANAEVFNAGDVDGDAANDLLITSDSKNYLIFGGDLPEADTLENLLADPDGDGPLLVSALELPEGAWRAIGNFDGADSEGNAYADLGAAVLVATDRLNESAQLEHQVVNVYLGGDRASLAEAFETEDLVIEPGRAFFFQQDTVSPSAAFFGGAFEVGAEGTVTTITEGSDTNNEVQAISHTGVGGTFTLSLGADTTADINYNATATDVELALEALDGITDVEVTGAGTAEDPWTVTFIDPGIQDVADLAFNAD
jgi:hypothetical protein